MASTLLNVLAVVCALDSVLVISLAGSRLTGDPEARRIGARAALLVLACGAICLLAARVVAP